MKQIASFTIDHMKLFRGVYVSRKDKIGNETITTFDIRVTRPNFDPVMQTGEVHTIEHLAATYLRNHPVYADKTVYFGPMGCRTGFYLLLGGDYESKDIMPLMIEMFEFIRDFEGEIPGATAVNCGNYSDMNLPLAKHYAKLFLDEVLYCIKENNLNYPA
jgi:LuxS protein involved in autoinducer AI2 synthesis